MRTIELTINGGCVRETIVERTHLADFLREHLTLTATHLRCEQGVCGACTVLIDGVPARSCITYAALCEGAEITTLEGLEDDLIVAALRRAFIAEHGLQCGFCTPGMLVTARDIVMRLPDADEARVRLELALPPAEIEDGVSERGGRGAAPLLLPPHHVQRPRTTGDLAGRSVVVVDRDTDRRDRLSPRHLRRSARGPLRQRQPRGPDDRLGVGLGRLLVPAGHHPLHATRIRTPELLAWMFPGGRARHRSADLTLFRRALYQLSYPTG